MVYKAQSVQTFLPHAQGAQPEVDGHVDAHITDCFSKQGESLLVCHQRNPFPVM